MMKGHFKGSKRFLKVYLTLEGVLMDLRNMTQPVIQFLHFQTEPGLRNHAFEGPKTEQFGPNNI